MEVKARLLKEGHSIDFNEKEAGASDCPRPSEEPWSMAFSLPLYGRVTLLEEDLEGIIGSVIRFFLGIFAPEKLQELKVKQWQRLAGKRRMLNAQKGENSGSVAAQANPFPRLSHDNALSLLKQKIELEVRMNQKKVPQAHSQSRQATPPDAPLRSCDGSEWIGYELRDGQTLKRNSTVPITESVEEQPGKGELYNVYFRVDASSHITITTSKIDTKVRALQFVEAIRAIRKEYTISSPLRIVIHQLNSGIRDYKILRDQIHWVSFINRQLETEEEKLPVVIHKNMCMNGFSTHFITRGFERSRDLKHNLRAVATGMVWFFENNPHLLSAKPESLTSIRSILSGSTEQKELETLLEALTHQMHGALASLQEEAEAKLRLATHLLAIQMGLAEKLGFPLLSYPEQMGLHLLLDHYTGAVTQINCKSGLDRTGFVRALSCALEKSRSEDGLAKTYALLIHLSADAEQMDKTLREAMQNSSNCDLDSICKQFSEEERVLLRMQRNVFDELIGVALPIIERSIGTGGLRWGDESDLERNPHPLLFLPACVVNEEKDSAPKVEWLVAFNRDGSRHSLSDIGRIVLQRSSSTRPIT